MQNSDEWKQNTLETMYLRYLGFQNDEVKHVNLKSLLQLCPQQSGIFKSKATKVQERLQKIERKG